MAVTMPFVWGLDSRIFVSMQFRCPNCQHSIKVEEEIHGTAELETLNTLECPSCHSTVSLTAANNASAVSFTGTTIDQFEVQELLGEGSFGSVYKAWDRELMR